MNRVRVKLRKENRRLKRKLALIEDQARKRANEVTGFVTLRDAMRKIADYATEGDDDQVRPTE